ncbi:MAG: hypothetical protein A3G20_08095 [Acidobacteria bacterium RIFCSPLOWO2_12_FULL_59_11]|nr:MAG: hypothetical protein A3G20_08095 [Acidobacteria bacterium RIFCSPLOWO2_12_FULL_59_11]
MFELFLERTEPDGVRRRTHGEFLAPGGVAFSRGAGVGRRYTSMHHFDRLTWERGVDSNLLIWITSCAGCSHLLYRPDGVDDIHEKVTVIVIAPFDS